MSEIALKRAYELSAPGDGKRILVERLWPRGISKEKASLDLWLKDIAPSADLRAWYGHEPEKWSEFRRRYLQEIKENPEAVDELRRRLKQGRVTFVFAARDEEHSSARVLKDYLEKTP
jgi:uncharacterized protein YeaO (DUF488 family)